jgi:hypothetical protein
MACPSDALVEHFLAENSSFSVMGQIREGGVNPIPQLENYFKTCMSQDKGGDNPMIPCPTDSSSQTMMNCGCAAGDFYLWDFSDLSIGPQCKWWADATSAGELVTTDAVAYSITMMHQTTWERLIDLCNGDPKLAEAIWPEFYHLYSTKVGRDQVEQFLKENPTTPPAAAEAIRDNANPLTQSLYCLLNGYDWNRSQNKYESFTSGSYYTASAMELVWMGYKMKDVYFRLPIGDTNFADGWYGDPFWSLAERQDNYRRAIGSPAGTGTIANGKDFVDQWAQAYVNLGLVGPGQSADNYFDPAAHVGTKNWTNDPNYTGNLPKKLPLDQIGEEYIHRETTDPTGHGYVTQCGTADITEKLLPIIGGAVGGAVTAMIVPGEIAKIAAFVVGSYSCYEIIGAVYGSRALANWDTTLRGQGEKNAAVALTTGLPLAILIGVSEMGWLPVQFSSTVAQIGLVSVVVGSSYFLLEPTLEELLVSGGEAAEILLSPVSVATGVIHWFMDGCAKQQVHFDLKCYCQNSNDKPALSDALVIDLYGATGEQAKLRTKCMHAAMTQGTWGTDPYYMGTCDDNGWMSTPMACVSAGEFAYTLWDKSLKDLAIPMWGEIQHCLDPINPSMLPPQDKTSANDDGPCVAKYGQYARVASGNYSDGRPGVAGQCYDYRAPAQNALLGVSSSYDWSKVEPQKSECTIL